MVKNRKYGWDNFTQIILDEFSKVVLKDFDKYKDELGQVMMNDLLNLKGPKKTRRKTSRDEIFFGKIFRGFGEIFNSYRSLQDIEIYINSFPYRNKSITKPRYLKYHLENYYNEVYILRERLLSFLTLIGRSYKKDIRHKIILKLTRPVFKIVSSTLSSTTYSRGQHIHVSRYYDKDIERLEDIALLLKSEDQKILDFFSSQFKFNYILTRKKWKNKLKNNNKVIKELLDVYSDIIKEILFDSQNKIRYPVPIKK